MHPKRKIALLGSTGSIGRQTLEVVEHLGGAVEVRSLAAGRNLSLLEEQILRLRPKLVCVADEEDAKKLSRRFPQVEVYFGAEGLERLAADEEVDTVVNAVVGRAGLAPSWRAVAEGKRLCTANKESLVMAGEVLTRLASQTGAQIFPIDSEHSALWQAALAGKREEIKRIILTASGGPFWGKKIDPASITPEDALEHPTWRMGPKITVDSATLMNKGFEVIEARWMFDIPPERIDVLIHPQSIVHSIVEFVDGSQIAQMSLPDMRLPIQYALTYPQRLPSPVKPLRLEELCRLEFFAPEQEQMRVLSLAYRVLEVGGTAPTILCTTNELAVRAFLAGRISFDKIIELAERALEEVVWKPLPHDKPRDALEAVLEADKAAEEWFNRRVG